MPRDPEDRPDRLRIQIGERGERINAETGEVLGQDAPARSIEDLANEDDQAEMFSMPLVAGKQGVLTDKVGGRRVTSAELRFKSHPLSVSGQFKEGDRVRMVMEFEVTDVNFPLVRSAGQVVGKLRQHTGELVGWRQVNIEGPLFPPEDRDPTAN